MRIGEFIQSLVFRYHLLRCPPVVLPTEGDVGVCTVAGSAHRDMLIHTLLSFYYVSKKALPCMVVDDGTLTTKDKAKIRYFFPGVNITNYTLATKRLQKILRKYPHSYRYRMSHLAERLNVKLFDPFLLSPFEKIIYMDCDILYYKKPTEILRWASGMSKKALFSSEYSNVYPGKDAGDISWSIVTAMFQERINPAMDTAFTSGLFCIRRSQYSLSRVEEILTYMYHVGLAETWTTEQFIFAVLSAEMDAAILPPTYRHIPYAQKIEVTDDTICIHCAYLTKPFYVSLALRRMKEKNYYQKQE